MQRTAPLLVKYIGSTAKEALPAPFQKAVESASKAMEVKYPNVQGAKIQGSQPHVSSKDPNDQQLVITVSYHTANGTRVASVHAHDDDTFTEFPSRNAAKGK